MKNATILMCLCIFMAPVFAIDSATTVYEDKVRHDINLKVVATYADSTGTLALTKVDVEVTLSEGTATVRVVKYSRKVGSSNWELTITDNNYDGTKKNIYTVIHDGDAKPATKSTYQAFIKDVPVAVVEKEITFLGADILEMLKIVYRYHATNEHVSKDDWKNFFDDLRIFQEAMHSKHEKLVS